MWGTLAVALAFVAVSRGEVVPKECQNAPEVDIDDCCMNAPDMGSDSEEMIKSCITNNKTECEASDCIAKIGNYLSPDGKVNPASFKTQFHQWGNDIVDTLLQACTLEMGGSNVTCKSETLLDCMTGALFVTCPASMWNSTADCSAAKAHVLTCGY